MNDLDKALFTLREVRGAILGCLNPTGDDLDGYRIRHGELKGWFDQLEEVGLRILMASISGIHPASSAGRLGND